MTDNGILPTPPEFEGMTRLEQMKEIVKRKTGYEIEGVFVDIQSANVYSIVHEACNEVQKGMLAKMKLVAAIQFCWKCVK